MLRVVLLMALLGPARAQILLNPPKDASVITVDVDLVNVLCAVRDKNGGYVKSLAKDDFEIREDGRRQQISLFAREVDSPLTLAMLIDVSGSVSRIVDIEKAAAARFFSEVMRPGDKALLAGFADTIVVWRDFTSSTGDLASALDRVEPFSSSVSQNPEVRPRGGTLLYDAVTLVATRKLMKQPGRKAILVITDGLDNGSLAGFDKASRTAQEADAVIYAIHYEDSVGRSLSARDGLAALHKLADPTGGRTFHVDAKTPLEAIFETIREEMRSQYGLGYKSSNPATDGAFRRLDVKLSRPGLKAQARKGYYAVKR